MSTYIATNHVYPYKENKSKHLYQIQTWFLNLITGIFQYTSDRIRKQNKSQLVKVNKWFVWINSQQINSCFLEFIDNLFIKNIRSRNIWF